MTVDDLRRYLAEFPPDALVIIEVGIRTSEPVDVLGIGNEVYITDNDDFAGAESETPDD